VVVRLGSLVAILGAAAALSGCGLARGVVSNAGLTIYNGQHPQTTDELVTAFEKKTGIKVSVESNDEDTLSAQLQQEGLRTSADVYYTENSNWLALIDNHGLFAKVDPSTLAGVPARDNAADSDWVGVSARVSCLIYNPSKIKASELPTSILQLSDPKYHGLLGVDSGETDLWPVVYSVDRAIGPRRTLVWLGGLASNAEGNVHIPDNETLTSDVNTGVVGFGVINQYYYYRLQAEVGKKNMHSKIVFFRPGDPGYVEDISGAGILRGSKHKEAAQKFLAFMTSAEGQRIIAGSDSFEYPIRPGIAANRELIPLDKLHPNGMTPAVLGASLEGERLLDQAGLL
jgi:iron(III) transport system substrate-binding protein